MQRRTMRQRKKKQKKKTKKIFHAIKTTNTRSKRYAYLSIQTHIVRLILRQFAWAWSTDTAKYKKQQASLRTPMHAWMPFSRPFSQLVQNNKVHNSHSLCRMKRLNETTRERKNEEKFNNCTKCAHWLCSYTVRSFSLSFSPSRQTRRSVSLSLRSLTVTLFFCILFPKLKQWAIKQ